MIKIKSFELLLSVLVMRFYFSQPQIVSTQNATLEGLYKGCFTDKQSSRDLSGYHYEDNAALTIEKCMTACEISSARYFGVQFKFQCFCGNSYGSFGDSSNCTMKCKGDVNQICGGLWSNSVYKIIKYNLRNCKVFHKMDKNRISLDLNANTVSSPIPTVFNSLSLLNCLILCTTVDDCNMLSFSFKQCTLFDSPNESVDALNSIYLTDPTVNFYKRKC